MTPRDQRTIGLDRPLRLDWLDAVAGRLAAGDSPKAAREYVWDLLEGVVAGSTAQTGRGKTVTVLARVWLSPPAGALSLRDSALKVVEQASADERLAIHWAMLSGAYPFFVDVAGMVGKSLGLNGEVALSQLTRRLVDTWGDRSTLRPAAQRLVRSMAQWGILRAGDRPGLYLAPSKRTAVPPAVGELMVESLLVAAQRGMPLSQLLGHPALFPFDLRVDLARLRRSDRLRIHRQGDQTDLVELVEHQARKPPDDAPAPSSSSDSGGHDEAKGKSKEGRGSEAKPARDPVSAKRKRTTQKASDQIPLFGKAPDEVT